MKIIVLLLALTFLSGCGLVDRFFAKMTGDATTVCMSGVTYYQFTSGSAPAYKSDGSLITCN